MLSQITLSYFGRETKRFEIPRLEVLFAEVVYRADQRLVPALGQEAYYQFYYLLGKYFAPKRILEIGTRFGYSLIALAKGSRCDYAKSIDLQSYQNPFGMPSQRVASENLKACCPWLRTEFLVGDSRGITLGAEEQFDLIHIDGAHSADGCRDDILQFWPQLAPNGVMLVDDLDQGSVRNGYAQAKKLIAATEAFFPTKHGCGMLWKKPESLTASRQNSRIKTQDSVHSGRKTAEPIPGMVLGCARKVFACPGTFFGCARMIAAYPGMIPACRGMNLGYARMILACARKFLACAKTFFARPGKFPRYAKKFFACAGKVPACPGSFPACYRKYFGRRVFTTTNQPERRLTTWQNAIICHPMTRRFYSSTTS
jgi:predicted O-methyltransferase YrrM